MGQQLLEFFEKTEFGTAQFKAVSDYLDLKTLHTLRELNIHTSAGDNEAKTKRESEIRIYEMKIALLEHQIEQNKSQLSGYSKAYQLMETALKDIDTLARVEAEKKHADIKEQKRYARQIWEVAYDGSHEIVSMKKDTS